MAYDLALDFDAMGVSGRMLRRSGCKRGAWVLISIVCSVCGCQGQGGDQGAARAVGGGEKGGPIRIAAASDLQQALPSVVKQFEARTGIATTLTFDASGRLAEQIRNGAPFDVYMAANESFVAGLAKDGLIRGESVQRYARGSLVLVVYRELGDRVSSLSDLRKPEVKKIALANPAFAPYGKAGKEALERAGLWKELESKIVQAESVKQALVYAQRGDAEAALVGRALADVPEVRTVAIDAELYDPIVQAMGIVSESGRIVDSEKFERFVLDAEGQSILKGFGFMPAGLKSEAGGVKAGAAVR